jgi:beta-lactamase superfamily II metal-dependent hydrolase
MVAVVNKSWQSALATLLVVALLPSVVVAQTLRIYDIDVEQGDSTLIVMPSGKTLLIDSGNNGDGPKILAAMKTAGVTQIDAFVASHYHSDHYGGIDDLTEKLKIQVLESYDRGDKACCLPKKKTLEATFIDYQRVVGEDAIALRPGDTITLDPLVSIVCVASGSVVIGETGPGDGDKENDFSVGLVIGFAGFTAFFAGDMETHTEAKLAARDLVTNVDFYKASHHGSHSSSSLGFMRDLRPSVIVISSGNRKDYAHPRRVTLTTYRNLLPPPTVFQTNKYLAGGGLGGDNVADALIADPETVDQDGTIEITVDGTAATYALRYGTTSQTFPIKSPVAPATSAVVIQGLLPNPVGNDEQLEEVTLRNNAAALVSLAGWTLRDRSGMTWTLSGSLPAGQSRTFRRNGRPMSLNNTSDEITLLDASHTQRDQVSYSASSEGAVITTGH